MKIFLWLPEPRCCRGFKYRTLTTATSRHRRDYCASVLHHHGLGPESRSYVWMVRASQAAETAEAASHGNMIVMRAASLYHEAYAVHHDACTILRGNRTRLRTASRRSIRHDRIRYLELWKSGSRIFVRPRSFKRLLQSVRIRKQSWMQSL